MTLDDALGEFRASVMDHVQDRVHHWSDEQTEDYGFRMSLGDSDAILMHLPDGRTVRIGIAVTAVEQP